MSIKQKIVYLYFILLPFIDLITSLFTNLTDFPVSLGMIVKGFTVIFVIIYLFMFTKSKYKKISLTYLFLLGVFILAYFILKPDIWNINLILNEIVNIFRYMYFPIMLVGLINLAYDFDFDNKIIKKILFYNCITYTLLLLIPYFTGTGFSSYSSEYIYGEKGWFYAANEIGVIAILLIPSILFLLDNSKKWKSFYVFPILLSISIIGTKVSYFGMIIIVILTVMKFLFDEGKKGIILSILVLIFLTMACSMSPAISNLNKSISESEKIENNVNKDDDNSITEKPGNNKYPTTEEIKYNSGVRKVLNIILSGRYDFFIKNYNVYKKSGMSNILFGLGFSDRENLNYTFDRKLIEIDFLDVFIHYGLIGFIIYFLPLIYLIYKMIKNVKYIKVDTVYYILILTLGLSISCLAGHVLSAPSVSIYIILIALIIKSNIEETRIFTNKIKS